MRTRIKVIATSLFLMGLASAAVLAPSPASASCTECDARSFCVPDTDHSSSTLCRHESKTVENGGCKGSGGLEGSAGTFSGAKGSGHVEGSCDYTYKTERSCEQIASCGER